MKNESIKISRIDFLVHPFCYAASLKDANAGRDPFSAQLKDGRIMTVFYRTADPEDHMSTVVEGVIWELPF